MIGVAAGDEHGESRQSRVGPASGFGDSSDASLLASRDSSLMPWLNLTTLDFHVRWSRQENPCDPPRKVRMRIGVDMQGARSHHAEKREPSRSAPGLQNASTERAVADGNEFVLCVHLDHQPTSWESVADHPNVVRRLPARDSVTHSRQSLETVRIRTSDSPKSTTLNSASCSAVVLCSCVHPCTRGSACRSRRRCDAMQSGGRQFRAAGAVGPGRRAWPWRREKPNAWPG